MTISSANHKSLTVFALAMVSALVIALTLGSAHRATNNRPGVANTHQVVWSSQRDSDPLDNWYRVARGRLLYQLETHPPTHCIDLPRTQRIALGNLDSYIVVGANGRVSSGGQYVARQISVRLGTISAC